MNNEQAQTAPATHKWVTVDEAFLLCQEAGLDRTKKTIRSWCRHEHVDGKKQSTSIGERWMVDANSLAVKIRNELEFQRQSEPVRTEDVPVRTSAHPYEQSETRSNLNEQATAQAGEVSEKKIADLEREVRSLEIDKAVRDRHVDFLTKQNEEGQRNLLSQSRYIGHLETQVMQLGGKSDQSFLSAPIERTIPETEFSNPAQQNLHVD